MPVVTRRFALFSILALPACAATQPDLLKRGIPGSATEADISALTVALQALGPEVDPEEAARAARVSYEHTRQLAIEYQITDPALIHNVKVNLGTKPRGLCKHWAEDMEKRLVPENFETLTIHRAIGALVGVDHSTVIISRRGDSMYDGIVVDPWRKGGVLTWIATIEDTSWGWEPQFEVLDRLARKTAHERGLDTYIYSVEGKPPRCLVVAGDAGAVKAIPSTTDMSMCTGAKG